MGRAVDLHLEWRQFNAIPVPASSPLSLHSVYPLCPSLFERCQLESFSHSVSQALKSLKVLLDKELSGPGRAHTQKFLILLKLIPVWGAITALYCWCESVFDIGILESELAVFTESF